MLQGDKRLPRYQRLAETLREAISGHVWRPGDRLPSELDLADRYGVAPGTVRQAVKELVDEGLLERQHGRGTFIRKPSFDSSLFRFFRFHGEDGERQVPESRILGREWIMAPPNISHALQLPPRTEVIFMSRLRLLDDEPVLVEEIWLPGVRFAAFMEEDEAQIGPLLYPVYEELCGEIVASANERLTAEPVSEKHAQMLNIQEGSPVILIERLALGFDGTPIEWRRSRGRADRFQYHVEIR